MQFSLILLCSSFLSAASVATIHRPKASALQTDEVVLTSRGNVHTVGTPTKVVAANAPFKQLVNGSTSTGWIQLGTPKKWLYVIFDTGSDKLVAKTWESIQSELASVDQGIAGMVMPSDLIYNHATSSTYQQKFMTDRSNKSVPKMSSITYGSGTAICADGTETVLVGNRTLSNYTIKEITADSLQLLHTSKGVAGVLGLQHMKNKSLGNSLFSQMREAGSLTAFGYCRGSGNNGTFIWGDESTEGHEMDVVGEMHWAVKLGDVKVDVSAPKAEDKSGAKASSLVAKRSARKDAPWDDDTSADEAEAESDPAADIEALKDTCADNSCCAILDTGSNIIAGPSAVMKSIVDLVDVKPDCSNFDKLPNITMTFGGLPVTLHPSGYVMKVPVPSPPPPPSLSETHASTARASTHKRWEATFERLNKDYGIDLREMVNNLLKQQNDTSPEFMCMPALVPLDKHTSYGPLYVVGTPLLDAYYARWSFAKDDSSPKIHLKALEDATVCKDEDSHDAGSTPLLMRKDKGVKGEASTPKELRVRKSGPTERLPEEIRYPHWAKDLLHV